MTMAPNEFTKEVKLLVEEYGEDNEKFHGELDDLAFNLLRDLGYDEGLEIASHISLWYS